MYFPFFPTFIGLHVVPYRLTLVHLRQIRQAFSLLRAEILPLPQSLLAEGKIKDWVLFVKILKDKVEQLGLKGKACALALPSHLVRMQSMQLPAILPQAELEKEILARLHKDLPGLNDNLAIDYKMLSQDDAFLNLFVIATKKDYLLQWEEAIQAAGLHLKAIDVDVFALQRMAAKTVPLLNFNHGVQIIVHSLNLTTLFMVSKTGEMIFHQRLQMLEKDFLTQFKNKMELCRALIGDAQSVQLILCAETSRFKHEIKALFPSWVISELIFPNEWSMSKNIDRASLLHNKNEFSIAFGAAMRKVSLW